MAMERRARTRNAKPINRDLPGNRKCYNCDFLRITDGTEDEFRCILQDEVKTKNCKCIAFDWNPELTYVQGPIKDVEVEDLVPEKECSKHKSDIVNTPCTTTRVTHARQVSNCPKSVKRSALVGLIAGFASLLLLKKIL